MSNLSEEIKRQAVVFTEDNFCSPRGFDYIIIENAMLRGANIAIEQERDRVGKQNLLEEGS